jgi:uncharacterized membrane protein
MLVAVLDILFRWLHVIAACLTIGGAFFIYVILPQGTQSLDAEQREGVFLRCRRGYKFVVHPSILIFLVTGVYNTMRNWSKYKLNPGAMHGLWGTHLLLALAVMAIALMLLAGREPTRSHRNLMRINLVLMFLTVAASSSLKWVRDYTVANTARDVDASLRVRPRVTSQPSASELGTSHGGANQGGASQAGVSQPSASQLGASQAGASLSGAILPSTGSSDDSANR